MAAATEEHELVFDVWTEIVAADSFDNVVIELTNGKRANIALAAAAADLPAAPTGGVFGHQLVIVDNPRLELSAMDAAGHSIWARGVDDDEVKVTTTVYNASA